MIIDRKQFKLQNKCVIEKLHIMAPFRQSAVFENEACFLYFKEGNIQIKSPTEILNLFPSESVLLKCGNYFSDFIEKATISNCEVYAIHLHKDILAELFKNEIPDFVKPINENNFALKLKSQDIIYHFIESLEFYFQNPTIVSDELLRLKIKELILLLIQTNNATNILSLLSSLFTPRQANLKDIIQSHIYSNLSVKELATLSGRSLSAFKRDFDLLFKDTPANYIKAQRLKMSSQLLISTDLSISEICYKVGLDDPSHFTKLFKSKFGLTPSDYRKQNHK